LERGMLAAVAAAATTTYDTDDARARADSLPPAGWRI
jgi:hypothetical protein